MIDQSKPSTTLRVCLQDVGTHNKAVLDFFFAKLGQHTFQCVDTQADANVLFIDYDFPPARQRYESEYQAWEKPAIILSISEVSLDNAIWLPKPLTSRALLDAADSVQSLLVSDSSSQKESVVAAPVSEKTVEDVKSFVVPKSAPLQRPAIKPIKAPVIGPLVDDSLVGKTTETISADVGEAKENKPESDAVKATQEEKVSDAPQQSSPQSLTTQEQEQRWSSLCGVLEDFDVSSSLSSMQNEDSFFLSSVKDAVRLARQCQQGVLLNFPQVKIYVLPEVHRVFCPIALDSTEFIDLIESCNSGEGGKMHILSTPEIHELNDLISQQNNALYDLESFVWSSTLLSTKGLLSRELDPNKPVGLKHWPSLTRVELFPHIMPIAAQWSADAISAFDLAKSLNIPQRYVFSFYNAANALGLIEMDPEKLIKKQSAPRTTEAPSGLFSRLLKRLIGG